MRKTSYKFADVDSKLEGVSIPSTSIHVTDPRKIKWNINGDNWVLEVGRKSVFRLFIVNKYNMFIVDTSYIWFFSILVITSCSYPMYLFFNLHFFWKKSFQEARFETEIPLDHFKITSKSVNGTYFEVEAYMSGTTTVRSRFSSFIVNVSSERDFTIQILSIFQ